MKFCDQQFQIWHMNGLWANFPHLFITPSKLTLESAETQCLYSRLHSIYQRAIHVRFVVNRLKFCLTDMQDVCNAHYILWRQPIHDILTNKFSWLLQAEHIACHHEQSQLADSLALSCSQYSESLLHLPDADVLTQQSLSTPPELHLRQLIEFSVIIQVPVNNSIVLVLDIRLFMPSFMFTLRKSQLNLLLQFMSIIDQPDQCLTFQVNILKSPKSWGCKLAGKQQILAAATLQSRSKGSGSG